MLFVVRAVPMVHIGFIGADGVGVLCLIRLCSMHNCLHKRRNGKKRYVTYLNYNQFAWFSPFSQYTVSHISLSFVNAFLYACWCYQWDCMHVHRFFFLSLSISCASILASIFERTFVFLVAILIGRSLCSRFNHNLSELVLNVRCLNERHSAVAQQDPHK